MEGKMKKKIIDIKTGKETLLDFTSQDIIEFQKRREEEEQIRLDRQPEELAKEAARQSAIDKLSALGLSLEEILAITGF